jgi:hypothetical protein
MSTVNLDLSIMCICGQPHNAMVHGPGGHQYVPMRGADQIRDDQRPEKGTRRGHYALAEYRVLPLPQPAAAADWVATVPATVRWRVQCLQAQLTTSAAIANRVPHLQITDGQGHSMYNFPSPNNQTASSVEQYSAGTTVVTTTFDNANVLVLPYPMKLLPGWTIGTLTTALAAGDQWANIVLHVKEWLQF